MPSCLSGDGRRHSGDGSGCSSPWSLARSTPRRLGITTIDTIRALFTYTIATIVVAGGGYVIYAVRTETNSQDTVAIIAGFVGAALSFVFSTEVQTRTARQTQTASAQGAIAHANGISDRERDRSAQAADEMTARG